MQLVVASDGDVELDGTRHDLDAAGFEALQRATWEHLARADKGRETLLDPHNPHGLTICDRPVRVEIHPDARFDAFAWVIAQVEWQCFARAELVTSGGDAEPLPIEFKPSGGANVCGGARAARPASLSIALSARNSTRDAAQRGPWSLTEGPDDEAAVSAHGLEWHELVKLVESRRPHGGWLEASVEIAPDASWSEVAAIVRAARSLEPNDFVIHPPRAQR